MALKLKCPCGERLTAPESAAGKRGKCGKCGQRFIIPSPKKATVPAAKSVAVAKPSAPAVAPDLGDELGDLDAGFPDMGGDMSGLLDEALDEPLRSAPVPVKPKPSAESAEGASKKGGRKRENFKGLLLAIKLVLGGTVVSLLAIVLGVAAAFAGEGLSLVADIVSFVGVVLSAGGRLLCLTAPKRIGGKGFLIAAVICDALYMALPFVGNSLLSPLALFITAPSLWLGTFVLFILFVREIGDSLQQNSLVEAGSDVIYAVLIAGACLVGSIVSFYSAALAIFFICASVWRYVVLLLHTLECVDDAQRR